MSLRKIQIAIVFVPIFLFLIPSSLTYSADILPIKKFIIPQNGMYPSLPSKSTFWARKKPFFDVKSIIRGDIIVYYLEKDGKIYNYVWRVIGLPGDNIEIDNTEITINGKVVSRYQKEESTEQFIYLEKLDNIEYLVAYDKNPKRRNRKNIVTQVPENFFFLLGDNRDNAEDSRFTGFVPFENVIGKKL